VRIDAEDTAGVTAPPHMSFAASADAASARTGFLRTHSSMWLMLATSIIITSAVIVLAVSAIRSTEQVAADERTQTRVEQRLMGLSWSCW